MPNRVGVLALQGAFALHIEACDDIGVEAIEVRTEAQLDTVDRVIIPGGESTTMSMMLDRNELREPLAARLEAGMPAFGTCAGMILLGERRQRRPPGPDQFRRDRHRRAPQRLRTPKPVILRRDLHRCARRSDPRLSRRVHSGASGGTRRRGRRCVGLLWGRSGVVSPRFSAGFVVSSGTVVRPPVAPLLLWPVVR